MLNVPVSNFSVMSGWSPRFLGITSTFRGVTVSQHDGGRFRTPDLSLQRQRLYYHLLSLKAIEYGLFVHVWDILNWDNKTSFLCNCDFKDCRNVSAEC